jgi:hypothetical protein
MVFLPIVFAEEKIISIKKGDSAPFDGSLLSPDSVARILAEKEYQDKKCLLDKEFALARQQAKCDLDVNRCKVERDICNEKYNSMMKIRDEEIKRLQDLVIKTDKSNYNTLYFLGGIALGMAAVIGISYAVNK